MVEAASKTDGGGPPKPGWALVIPWDTTSVGGVSQVVLNLAAGLRSHGAYEPVVVVQEWAATQPRVEMRDGLRHVFVRFRTAPGRGDGLRARLLHPVLGRVQVRQLRRLFHSLGISVLNFHYPTLSAEPFAGGRSRDNRAAGEPRVIFSLHGLDIAGLGEREPEYQARYVRMLAGGDAVVAVSHAFADTVTTTLAPALAGRVTVIHNGVSSGRLAAAEPLGMPLPRRYLLNVATYEAKKGQSYLVEAFSRLAASHPDLHLVVAGRGAGAYDDIARQVARLGLTARVALLRDVPHREVGAMFAGATLFCLSSLQEPFGIVLLEAGVFGLPVVATRVGGVPEIVRDGTDGLLVPGADAAQLATAITALLADPERARALGASLRDRVRREFGWEDAVERYVALAAPPRPCSG
jgi:glycosyltransferase involved in cell wall biosynthesis